MKKLAINGGTTVRNEKLFYGKQWIDENGIFAIDEILRSDYVACNPKVTGMKRLLKTYTGAKHVIAATNNTEARSSGNLRPRCRSRPNSGKRRDHDSIDFLQSV